MLRKPKGNYMAPDQVADLEMVRLCAEAMGYRQDRDGGYSRRVQGAGMDDPDWVEFIYNPLLYDAQAMALVKRFGLWIWGNRERDGWKVERLRHDERGERYIDADSPDLNRAIVECVAKMQSASAPPQEGRDQ
jgi:hypothetical protein